MNKEIISTRQYISMIVMFIVGTTFVVGGQHKIKQDAWIAILVALIMSLPLIFIYGRLLRLFPNKNLFDIFEKVFGKVVGKITILIYTFYFFHLGSLVIRNITEFVQVVSFPETPQFFVALFLGILSIYMVKSGTEVLGRWTEFFLPFILFVLMVTILLSGTKFNFSNLQPILYNGWKPVISNAFSIFFFPLGEIVIFTFLFDSLKSKNSAFKIYLLSLVISSAIILIVYIRNILVLGIPNLSQIYFPAYYSVSLINIGEFIQRIEIIISIVFMLSGFAKISVCLLTTSIGVSKLFKLPDYKQICAPISFLMINLSIIIYSSTMEMFEWLEIYEYYALPFQIVLPLIALITARIRIWSGNLKVES
ncbi:endospore germination permease [Tissierella sp. MSJ-40]|uniref:Endospore germination permease n=1 Tax=Tissierella simiarum TaxID=2841534 RepID=A0ABS6ED89_9FIRM|nr:endospore germination permease [Tissierella simiarum]MBU5440138.1 endospore germination permease [Tissierella simiarum]